MLLLPPLPLMFYLCILGQKCYVGAGVVDRAGYEFLMVDDGRLDKLGSPG